MNLKKILALSLACSAMIFLSQAHAQETAKRVEQEKNLNSEGSESGDRLLPFFGKEAGDRGY